MNKIFKFTLDYTDNQIVLIPSFTILSAKEQNGKIVIYAIIDTEIEGVEYVFRIIPTGQVIDNSSRQLKYLDTVDVNGLMFHVFYKRLI